MNKDKLIKDLTRLIDEIDQLPLESAERAKLHRLIAEMEAQIASPEETERPQELADTLDQLIIRFEADHPAVTGVLRRVLNALSSMGV